VLDLLGLADLRYLTVTTDANLQWRAAPAQTSWSNRVLLLSLAGIFFLTLYPFRFAHAQSARFLFPFSLNGWGKSFHVVDIFLNILLFVPFGFGLGEKLRERGRSKTAALLISYLCGALLSYFVEFLQIYIPPRDSGWGDVVTNSAGALLGAAMFESVGGAIVPWFSKQEQKLESWLSLPKIGVFVALYAGFWCVLAGPLQKQTRLTNWKSDSFIAIGKSASLRAGPAWTGRIFRIDLWNGAVAPEQARKITGSSAVEGEPAGPLATYQLSGPGPFQDTRQALPSLDWALRPSFAASEGAVFDGRSWLISVQPAPTLVNSIENSEQFALRVICHTAASPPTDARILSLSSPSGSENLALSQLGSALAFWYRNPLSMRRARMTWTAPGVFAPDQTRNLLLSFDGTAVSLFVDGRDYGHPYEFGPGVALAHYVRHIKAEELPGYSYIFYVIIFFPAGCLVAFAWRKSSVRRVTRACFLAAAWLLPALAFEWILADAARRSISLQDVCFAALIALAGSLWMNADQSYLPAMRNQDEPISVR
jgi:glycopeptide antibiotics resistance protein